MLCNIFSVAAMNVFSTRYDKWWNIIATGLKLLQFTWTQLSSHVYTVGGNKRRDDGRAYARKKNVAWFQGCKIEWINLVFFYKNIPVPFWLKNFMNFAKDWGKNRWNVQFKMPKILFVKMKFERGNLMALKWTAFCSLDL